MKLIEQGSFEKKRVLFDPLNTFNFVRSIFLTQAQVQGSNISLSIVEAPLDHEFEARNRGVFRTTADERVKLPGQLFGDQLRLQQILVNLIKNALAFSIGQPIQILIAYEEPTQLLQV